MKNLDLLLINPPSSLKVYSRSRIRAAVPVIPLNSIALMAAEVRAAGYTVDLLNLAVSDDPVQELTLFLENHSPRVTGLTFTTPLYPEASRIVSIIRVKHGSDCIIIGGGVHATSLPEETMNETDFDVLFIGEADESLPMFLGKSRDEWRSVPGILFREKGTFVRTETAAVLEDLDCLPYPAWDLFDLSRYKSPKITSRRNPVGSIITSRGCIHRCIYCNKNVLGHKFRAMSAKRVVDEMEYTLGQGFREIHVWDDQFSTDLDRAKQICELIIQRNLDFTWNIFNGIRVNCLDEEFLRLAKRAGCYSISFGIESGSQKILNSIKKGITLDHSRRAIKLLKKIGIESVTYFMIGLPEETEETIEETIQFAKELNPDYAKVTVLIPLPDTEVFNMLDSEGRINSRDWSTYNFHLSSPIFKHPNLTQDQLTKAYFRFYKEFYFRPAYIGRQFIKGILQQRLFHDFYYMIKTFT